jgi:HSP20 family protein
MSLRAVLSTRYPNSVEQFLGVQRALRSLDDNWGGIATSELTKASGMSIRLDVNETENAFLVSADLPGLSEKEVDVSFDDGLLTIKGEKKVARETEGDKWHIVERSSGNFVRKLSVKTPIEASKIEAKFEKGVLTISLPKQPQEPASTHKIEIKTS